MAVDMFLKIDGIEGESKDEKMKNEIEITTFSFSAEQVGTAESGGGLGAGKVKFENFEFTMPTQKASPKLFEACASGKHIPTAVLSIRKAGGEQEVFLKHSFHDLIVSSFATKDGDPQPEDTVKFNFVGLVSEYKEQGEDGKLKGAICAGWDLKKNAKKQ
jgi:type VI secretion system secreted protein Hcp